MNNQGDDIKKGKKGLKKFIIPLGILLLILIVLLVRFLFFTNTPEAGGGPGGPGRPGTRGAGPGEEQVFTVNTTTAILGPIVDYLEINGEVVSRLTVETYPETSGVLSRLFVEIGDTVSNNQVIAQVDPSRPGLNFALNPVRARTSGTITAVNLDPGDVVNPQTSIVRIGDLGSLEVQSSVSERFISRVREGMTAELRLEAFPGQVFEAEVTRINPVVDPVTRSIDISINVPNEYGDLIKAGMFVEIRLVTDERDSVVKIPADTIQRRDGSVYVYVANGDTAEKRDIVPGVILEDVAEVVSGVEPGEAIVYQGQTLLEDGVRIRVIQNLKVIDQ